MQTGSLSARTKRYSMWTTSALTGSTVISFSQTDHYSSSSAFIGCTCRTLQTRATLMECAWTMTEGFTLRQRWGFRFVTRPERCNVLYPLLTADSRISLSAVNTSTPYSLPAVTRCTSAGSKCKARKPGEHHISPRRRGSDERRESQSFIIFYIFYFSFFICRFL